MALSLTSCAKMGSPDGGMYDDTPPKILSTSPEDKSTNVKSHKISIAFDEFIKLDNAQEKVIISPPQLETPLIKTEGKKVVVNLKDSLKENTTYTIDFSDAISDNNEGNPLGNYAYSFSTGEQIDTFEVSGNVLEAENLEPIKGIVVGLYKDIADSAFTKKPMLRVSRTDSRGHFVIKGIAPGSYRAFALNDADGNYMFNQKSEKIAFDHNIFTPSCGPAMKQDTTWLDSLHIDSIKQVSYTRFQPDNIMLLAFTEEQTDRAFLKDERPKPEKFTLFFTHGDKDLPKIKGLNFNEKDAFIIEPSQKKDTITYWLRDTALCNQDTLAMEIQYMMTDSTGTLANKTDTLYILSKEPYAKRLKKQQKERDEWQKEQDKAKKKGNPYETAMKPEALEMRFNTSQQMSPNDIITFESPTPLRKCDSTAIHLYSKRDTLWYKSPFIFRKANNSLRTYEIIGEWRPDVEYSLEIDSAAFEDIYGKSSKPYKSGIKIGGEDTYSALYLTLEGVRDTGAIIQLLDKSDNVVYQVRTKNNKADFYYLRPGTYYMRTIVDVNGNGKWDTGLYSANRQPEQVFYYPKPIECKAKWDVNQTWNVNEYDISRQKPLEITKQKPEKAKRKMNRNAERAKQLGLKDNK
jgi:uncharacterized protein (DUF2141 family)